MSVKPIAVHLADDADGLNRVRLALALAVRFGAHLDVVYTSPRIHMPAPAVGRAMSMAYIEAMAEEGRAHVAELDERRPGPTPPDRLGRAQRPEPGGGDAAALGQR